MSDQIPITLRRAGARYRALCAVEFLRECGFSLRRSIERVSSGFLADQRGRLHARRTIEVWWYAYSKQGFDSLLPVPRSDRGIPRSISVADRARLSRMVAEKPDATTKQIWRDLEHHPERSGVLPSYSTVRSYLIAIGFKPKTAKKIRESQSQLLVKQEELWMLDVLQGRLSLPELVGQLKGSLSIEDIGPLIACVKNHPLRYRNRGLAILSHKYGIRKATISRFLRVGENYVDGVVRQYRNNGVRWVVKDIRHGPRKHEQEDCKTSVFAILHAPPSSYGINRTTWRLKDIRTILLRQNIRISLRGISLIIRDAGYKFYKARKVLTSNDPCYRAKLEEITRVLKGLTAEEKFFSVDEYGPFAVKLQAGKCLMPPGQFKTVPQYQKSKGSFIVTAALELSKNQITHFYSKKKNTEEMLKLLEILLDRYADQRLIYFSWDAASWHASKRFKNRVEEINSEAWRAIHKCPFVKLAPLPSCAQFLNVIESVFSGMARAIIHNSDYQSVAEAQRAIDRYFAERNQHFKDHFQRAGKKIWGKERVVPRFHAANNCKDPRYRGGAY